MDEQEKSYVIEHLRMIQGVVNRLAGNSFLLKRWNVAVVGGGIAFFAYRNEPISGWAVVPVILIILMFWSLDAYYLHMERVFRKIYDKVRKKDETDFAMSPFPVGFEALRSWTSAFLAMIQLLFYGVSITAVLVACLATKGFFQ